MKKLTCALISSFLWLSNAHASDDCDSCRKMADGAYLVCLKKAKAEPEKKECDSTRDKQKNVCQLTQCMKSLF